MPAVDLQVQTLGGTVLKAAAADFPVSQEMAGALVQFQPGALRQASPSYSLWSFVTSC